ncbi:multidrug efflux pump [Panacagrimonas perspica]|uniref:Efflux pump membrane transporter n=1 Tax=Panacagrimonas perspica TaxID=381431 RepID=A0A4R7PDC9_9GAMM|nr:efflux RND transporter permease subunit [Panacagrimonas perspica]TDU32175.1 multidrug efflux pump [Panacagrimonas perspica]THD01126.1 multidrug efflux RND transporter permease [Panacagrimonas perspica]
MVNFFIDRPIFAWVLAIVVMLSGGLAVLTLPVSQYPSIAPPAISIEVAYPGASAETVQNTVTQVIEQQMSGIDRLMYFRSESNKDGSMLITLYFEQGTDSDIAQVQVQNKLQLATPLLPIEVQAQGLRVAKATVNFLLVIGFVSRDGGMSGTDIADYVASNVKDPISRTPGVGDVQLFGSQYAMRIWLDPAKLTNFGLTPSDVSAALQAQNVQIASGELGGLPSVAGQRLNATIVGPQRLQSVEEFERVLLKVRGDGSQVRLSDVATVALGGETYAVNTEYNGQQATGLAIKLATGANALDTAAAIHATMDQLTPFFPPGLEVVSPYDTTPFVRVSIREVIKTLFEATVLVFLVIYLFLQNFRATLIPTIAVPVVLLGTFGILAAAGYSINTLTMFGMVLSIGMLVDDAIVVVENVERVMAEEGLSPREATRKSMKQITSALVGIALVLGAVFLPMAFFGGSTGVIYRQFSITVVSAISLSVLVAMLFTPSLCATMLKPVKAGEHHKPKRGPLAWFNRGFERMNHGYEKSVVHVTRRRGRYFGVYALIVLAMAGLFTMVPSAFLPDEDQGILFVQVDQPPGTASEVTQQTLNEVRDYFLREEKEAVTGVFTVNGFSFGGRGQNSGLVFVKLKDWEERDGDGQSVFAITERAQEHFKTIITGKVAAFAPPAVLELGNAMGFDFELLDRANLGHEKLMEAREQLLEIAGKDPAIGALRGNGLPDEPQYQLEIDWEKASALGLSIADVSQTLGAGWGSSYVNQFIDRGRVKKVFIQGAAESRMLPQDLDRWHVRNAAGQMVPFSAFSTAKWGNGSPKLERYNGMSALQFLGEPAKGHSTGEAMAAMEAAVAKLPSKGFGFEWTGLSYEERRSGSQAPALYAISLIIVFLCLAALYESWAIPVSVMLVVPLGIIGTVTATLFRDLANDVFFQVGLLATVGLSAKSAILIVEFAKENHDQGMDLFEATVHAARQRLRPILMTSMAFILGMMPLAVATGAGAGGRIAIGTGVIGGMISATILAVFFVPVFFVAIRSVFKRKPRPAAHDDEDAPRPIAEEAR